MADFLLRTTLDWESKLVPLPEKNKPSGRPLEPFRFLDLPKEIRLMIYERLPTQTKHYLAFAVMIPTARLTIPELKLKTSVVLRESITTDILRVSRQIHEEAIGIMNLKLDAIRSKPLRVCIPACHMANAPSCPVHSAVRTFSPELDEARKRGIIQLDEEVLRDARMTRLKDFMQKAHQKLAYRKDRAGTPAGGEPGVEVALRFCEQCVKGGPESVDKAIRNMERQLFPQLMYYYAIGTTISVRLRPGTLTATEVAKVQQSIGSRMHPPEMVQGDDLDEEEWAEEWEEGERCSDVLY
jgi:hypothetical protein